MPEGTQIIGADLAKAMCYINFPAGDYDIGISQDEISCILSRYPCFGPEWFANASRRRVRVKSFAIARNSVTSAEFADTLTHAAAAGETVSRLYWVASPYATICLRSDGRYAPKQGDEALPVSGVTLAGARYYACAHGARLPREKEWEIAARAQIEATPGWNDIESTMNFVNGFDTIHPGARAHRRAFLDGRGPVAESVLPATEGAPIGMIGNLWEWCEPATDGPDAVLRGGCWNDIVPLVFHPAFRHPVSATYGLTMHFGLRLAASSQGGAS
jgi:formylglycine-generating enzyme required for sulfatase activity